MPTKVLLTGATGLLGREIAKALSTDAYEPTLLGHSRLTSPTQVPITKHDLLDAAATEKLVTSLAPAIIIHSAANRRPDSVDADPSAATALNVTATEHLAQLCATHHIILVYISTDYVFSGAAGEAPYAASTPVAPPNLYGRTKADGEARVLQGAGKYGVVLRVPLLYGPGDDDESAVNQLVDVVRRQQGWKEGDKKTKVDDWALRYPTLTTDVALVVEQVSRLYVQAAAAATGREERDVSKDGSRPRPLEDLPRILQFSAQEKWTKYAMCALFAEIMGWSPAGLEPVSKGPKEGELQRPYDCHLGTEELQKLDGVDLGCEGFEGWWRVKMRAFRH